MLDWGIAFDPMTPDDAVVGTELWSAPEQTTGRCSLASDVYALGKLLASHPTDAALRAVAERAHHPDANERYPTANHVADELQRWLDGHRVDAYP